jgi:hypothetical protein
MWVYTNSPTWELIGNNTHTWECISTVTWVYTNTLTWELNRYRPDRTDRTTTTHFKSFHMLEDLHPGLGFQPGTKMACNCRSVMPSNSTASISAHFIYIPYNKNTIRKSGLYDLTRMAYSQSLVNIRAHHATHTTLPILTGTKKIRRRRTILSPTRYFAEIE